MSDPRVGWFVIEAQDAKKRKIWQVLGWHHPYSVRQVRIKTKNKVKTKIITTKQDVINYITKASSPGWVQR